MDIRVYPYPPELKIVSEPGTYTGWGLTIDLESGSSTIVIMRGSPPELIAQQLEELAQKVRRAQHGKA